MAVFALRMQCMYVVTEVTDLCVTMVGAAYQNFALPLLASKASVYSPPSLNISLFRCYQLLFNNIFNEFLSACGNCLSPLKALLLPSRECFGSRHAGEFALMSVFWPFNTSLLW